jgi:ATP-dependent Clp endopeptidase proteolytic subunit ClpP
MSKPAKWYEIKARVSAELKSAEVFIYGDIGESWYDDSVTAAEFVKEITALDVDELTVRINSYGGSVTDGIAIYNAIKRHKAVVTICVDGLAASIASLIAMSGDKVQMAENALMMIHAPWGGAIGNSVELRKYADMLDTWAKAMAGSYASKSGTDEAEILALLTDGEDHWYTAQECVDMGFADETTAALALAASLDTAALAARFRSLPNSLVTSTPAAAAAQPKKENTMSVKDTAPAAAAGTTAIEEPVAGAQKTEAQIRQETLAQETDRRNGIATEFAKFSTSEGVPALMAACQNDPACSIAIAREKLLAHLGKESAPVAGHYAVTVDTQAEGFRAAAASVIMARAAVPGAKAVDAANPLRGMRMIDIARECLARAGINVKGMDQRQIVAAAFTQSGSDFPILLENVLHKTLQSAYAVAPDTWSRFCKIGSVSDFREHSRYRVGSIANLDVVNELGEFSNKAIPDGEKGSITADTKGNIINISRQAIINDDLDAFVGLATMLGRAAKRTIERDVYAMLSANSGFGPTMSDGKALFHVDHGNISGSAGVPSVTSIEAARVAMASQRDISGNDYLDLRPAIWLGPVGLGGQARVANGSEYDPDSNNKLQRTNIVRGLFRDIVDTPRLSGTPWYLFADPSDAPVFEVAFLDGVQEPYIELENGFDVDGARWKVRLDFGVAAIDTKGAVRNAGA